MNPELRRLRAPDESGSEQRAWEVVRGVYAERTVVARRPARRLLLAPAGLVVAAALALTPAGAAVHRLIERALGVPHASPALFSLPAPGRLLVAGPGGAFTISSAGLVRDLGSWRQASWSPRGLYVTAVSGDELAALNPRGAIQWMLARPQVRDPRWYEPTGYRVAYRSRDSVRIVAGDGTADHMLAVAVAPVAPAWRSGFPYQLAYATPRGAVVLRDADTGVMIWSRVLPAAPRWLQWSADGSRLLARLADRVLVLDGAGRILATVRGPDGPRLRDAALAPDGRTLALLADRDVVLESLPPAPMRPRQLFTGQGLRQLLFSPDGKWVVVSWPAADQWVFVRAAGRPRIEAVSHIAEQFAGGRVQPALAGWCCWQR